MQQPSQTVSSTRLDTPTADALWQTIGACLRAGKERIQQEITNYPAPIPACDEQFNHLLEVRDAISRELSRFDNLRDEDARCTVEAISEFVAASPFIDADTKRNIRASLS